MNATIPSHVVGYTLNQDECRINLPNGTNLMWRRDHPVRQANGEYQPGAEWCGMFQSRMRSIIKAHGFPILHEQGMRPMIASTKEEAQAPQEEPSKPQRWAWMMEWCRRRGLSPADQDAWKQAQAACDDAHRAEPKHLGDGV